MADRPRGAGTRATGPGAGIDPASRHVGALFRGARKALRLSQQQVAELTRGATGRVSRAMVGSIERGENMPGLEVLVSLCRVLRLDPMEVLERVELSMAAPIDLTGLTHDDLLDRARACFWAGDYRGALAHFDAMLELLALDPPGDPDEILRRHARIEINRATALRRCGALMASRAAAERAVSLTEESPELRSEAYIVLADLHARAGNTALADDAAARAVELSASADERVQGMAWNQKGVVSYGAGRYDDARRTFLEARKLLRRAGARHHEVHVEGNIGMCLLGLGRVRLARARLLKAIELGRRYAVPALEASWLIELGRLELAEGRPGRADRHALAALKIAAPLEHTLTVFRGEWLRHLVAVRRDPKANDRHRIAYLKKLYVRLDRHAGVDDVREFKETVLAGAARRRDRRSP